ncbi:MAG: SGNH/GDSL hydrolase family protein, partial [Lentisphaeria bacterium]|nr:SGNH/GDSL hydrolase family protein [Lentisphaeria bacterium]
ATITDSAGCSIISPPIGDGAWRQAAYEGIEITYRGDGSSNRIPLYLSGPGEKGKAAIRTRVMLPLDQKEWKTLVLSPPKPAKGKPTLQLNTITSLYFACRNTFTFSVASIRLLTQGDLRKIEEAKPVEQRNWEAAVGVKMRALPGFKYVLDTPGLPRVLIVGDSITIHYTHLLRKQLEGKVNVHRIPANGGPTERGLANLDKWLRPGNWDVICFNFGLHDSKFAGWDRKTGKRYSTPEAYGKNLEQLVVRLKATGVKLIWLTTTPIPEGAKTHDVGDSVEYNKVAAPIMRKHGIPVTDLYALVKPDLATYIRPRNIHFNPVGCELFAQKVAKDILAQLKTTAD